MIIWDLTFRPRKASGKETFLSPILFNIIVADMLVIILNRVE
jgi:hypothetical protein